MPEIARSKRARLLRAIFRTSNAGSQCGSAGEIVKGWEHCHCTMAIGIRASGFMISTAAGGENVARRAKAFSELGSNRNCQLNNQAKMVKAVDGALGATVFTPGEKLCGKHVRAQVGHVCWVQDIKDHVLRERRRGWRACSHKLTNILTPTHTPTNQPYRPFILTNILAPILYAAMKLCNKIACLC